MAFRFIDQLDRDHWLFQKNCTLYSAYTKKHVKENERLAASTNSHVAHLGKILLEDYRRYVSMIEHDLLQPETPAHFDDRPDPITVSGQQSPLF